MVNNPYYVQPVNVSPGLAGLSASVRNFTQVESQRRVDEREQQQLKAATEEAIAAYHSGDADMIAEVSIKYPKISELLTERINFKNEKTKENYLWSAYRILEDPSPENVQETVQKRQAFLRANGVGEEGSMETDRFMAEFLKDPEKATKALEAELAAIDAPRFQIFQKAREQKQDTKLEKEVYFNRYHEMLEQGDTEKAEQFARYAGIFEDPNASQGNTDLARYAANAETIYKDANPKASAADLARVRNKAMRELRRAQEDEVTATKFAARNVEAATAERIAHNGEIGKRLAQISTAYDLIKASGDDTPLEKQTKAKQRLTGSLATLAGHYTKLDSLGGVLNIENSTFENIFAATKSSAVGQQMGRILGTEDQSTRQAIKNLQPLLVQDIRQSTDMGARGMDSEKELEFYLRAATSEKVDLQSNIAAIIVLDQSYGTGDIAAALQDKADPSEIERIRTRGARILEGGETIIATVPGIGQVTEADIQTTMRENNMTREQVLKRLGIE